jgi:hypothetical protein
VAIILSWWVRPRGDGIIDAPWRSSPDVIPTGDAMTELGLNIPWKRFWIPRDTPPSIGSGYLEDPDGPYGKFANPRARTLEQLEDIACVALLGEPGIGKSYEVERYRDQVRARDGDESLLYVDFRWHREALDQEISEKKQFQRWLADGARLTLILDSLDEHPKGPYEVASWLIRNLPQGPVASLRLRIACRSAEWPAVLDERLPKIWGSVTESTQVAFFALAPLRAIDVEMAAGKNATAFLKEVARVGAEPLASKPITLHFLLTKYHQHKSLPSSRIDLYEEGCLALCDDPSLSRADNRRTGTLRPHERLAIASRIAAVSMLCQCSLIQQGPRRGSPSEGAVQIHELLGAIEPTQHGDVAVTEAAIREVLGSGLFAPHGTGCVGWRHQTYAEFLAARFLKVRGLSTEQLVREVSNQRMGRTVPALRETIAWLASMDADFRQRLLGVDPEPLLGSDFAMVGDKGRELLVDALLEKMDRREILGREILWNRDTQASLAHPGLAEQLRPYLVQREHYVMARRAAIGLAEGCRVVTLQGELANLTLDADEDAGIRADAARALVHVGSPETIRRLKPLVRGEGGPDPEDELKGSALEALWPEDLTAGELFANLTQPNNASHGGSYWSFLSRLEETLQPVVLPEALRWTMGLPSRHSDGLPYAFESLLDAIMKCGWEYIEKPDVRSAFADAVRKRLGLYDGIFGMRGYPEDDQHDLAKDERRRRMLTSALIALPPWSEHDAFEFLDKGLLMPCDVPWAIEQIKGAASNAARLRRATILAGFFYYGRWSFEVAEPIIDALSEIEELRQAMPDVPRLVVLGSPESRWMRRDYRRKLKHAARLRRMLRLPLNKRQRRPRGARGIRQCMRRFDGGDIHAGWQLLHWMAIGTGGHAHAPTFAWDIEQFPGWKLADEEMRKHILDIGRGYLLHAEECSDEWLGQDNFDPAAAGYRYLCLLDRHDPAWLEQHSETLWRKWAAIPLAFPFHNGHEQNCSVVARAYRANPSRVLDVLRTRLERDNELRGSVEVLRRMKDCWDETLAQFLMNFVQRPELKPTFFSELLDDLVTRKIPGSLEYATSFLARSVPLEEAARLRMHAAACTLLVRAPETGWPAARPLFESDTSFGREVFLAAAGRIRFRQSREWCKALSTDDLADMYIWLSNEVPLTPTPKVRSRGSPPVTPQKMADEVRNALLNELVSRGSPESLAALERIQQAFPQRDWTWELLLARDAASQGTWTPRSPREIIELRSLPVPPIASARTMTPTPPVAHGVDFPPPLLEAYRQNKLAVLFGSGLSLAKDVKGNFPKWSDLPDRFLDHLKDIGVWTPDRVNAMRAVFRSGHLALETMLSLLDPVRTELRNARQYQAAMDATFRPPNAAPGDVHQALVDLGVNILVTTNYDPLVEHIEGPPRRTPYTWREAQNALSDINAGRHVLFKIHGTAEKADTVVMTQAEYAIAAADNSYQRVMSLLLQDYTFLLVGYGINDPLDLDLVFELNAKAFGTASRRHYALIKEPARDRDRWSRDFNVQVLPYQDHDHLPAILRSLKATNP